MRYCRIVIVMRDIKFINEEIQTTYDEIKKQLDSCVEGNCDFIEGKKIAYQTAMLIIRRNCRWSLE